MTYKNLKIDINDSIATLTINRPDKLNALNKETLIELRNAVQDLEQKTTIKVVILTGAGKPFIAGADITQMKDMNSIEAKHFAELGHSVVETIENSRLIFIAMVNGYALGGGCEIIMGCDLIIASKKALIGQPEINLGVHPGFGGTQRLTRHVGRIKAKELILTGDNISAEEAHRIGLVNIVVEPEQLLEETTKLAQKIASKSAIQTAFVKELINKGADIDLKTANSLEISLFATSFSTQDQKEGMNAFIEKRKPNFKDK